MQHNLNKTSTQSTILITGAAGFIGSCMVQFLNNNGYENLIIVDDFGVEEKRNNWQNKIFTKAVERQSLFEWLNETQTPIHFFIHLGARTDTTEFNYDIHQLLNVEFSQQVWQYCCANDIPLIYASSAATYGNGNNGYDDNHELPFILKPLNPYGISKNEFDKWAITQNEKPNYWAGLKFFNVYGPNEYHKGRMASVIWHSFNQIKKEGYVKLFKSHKQGYNDGQQLRDFIYVKDLINVIFWMFNKINNQQWQPPQNGLYNLGTGEARSFEALVNATFEGLGLQPKIEYIDMPMDLRDTYQYFTQANMSKLQNAGYNTPFYTLENGVNDYVHHYLANNLAMY